MKKIRLIFMCILMVLILSACGKNSKYADGLYEINVSLSGGSGRASIESPTRLAIKDNVITATITWSSPNYVHMKVGENTYYPVNTTGNSTFMIPVTSLKEELLVSAQTVAMSVPHDIEYKISFDENTLKQVSGLEALAPTGTLELKYANQYSVDFYEGGYALISISDGNRYLVIPENMPAIDNLEAGIKTIKQPISNAYLTATATMSLFDELSAIDCISLSGTQAEGWYVENAKKAMEAGRITYAGKYNEPDYELILSKGCKLAIENTMLLKAPEVKEKLEELGVTVFTDMSSYETEPMGRSEWIKLYGVMTGKLELAQELFEEQDNLAQNVEVTDNKKTVAFFYISSAGTVVTRRSGDYITTMIERAGGKYLLGLEGDTESSNASINMDMESFYKLAKDADYIIYNCIIDSDINNVSQLIAKNELLKDFKAVKEGNVWCLGRNLYQETLRLGNIMSDMNMVFLDKDNKELELKYLYHIK